MYVQMTCQAFGEHFQQFRCMGCRWFVAIAALGNHCVFGVTFRTSDLAVLAWGAFPLHVNVFMAGITGQQVNISAQGNCQRLVNRVTLHTCCLGLSLKMRFMALATSRNVTVPIMVATVTCLFSVLAWELLQFGCLRTVAIGADSGQHMSHRYAFRCVWILVTIHTLDMLGAMRLAVTSDALRHDLRIVFLQRIVRMEYLMTFAAVELVLAAGNFQVAEMLGVALAALSDG